MKMAKKKLYLIILIIFIIIAAITTMSLASFFCSSLYIDVAQNTALPAANFENKAYLVSVAKSQSELAAEALAADHENAAQYIWKEGDYFYVIYCGADKENDANLIKNALEKSGLEVQILPITFSQFSLEEGLSAQQQSLASEAISSFMQSFKKLNDIAVGLDTNVYSLASATDMLSKLKEKLTNLESKYRNMFASTSASSATALGQYLADELESVSLTEVSPQSLKYHSIEILEIYKNMTTAQD